MANENLGTGEGGSGQAGARHAGAQAERATEALKREGRNALESAKESGRAVADERKADAAEFLRDVSSAIHSGAEELRNRQRAKTAEYVDRAADNLAGFGEDLGRRDVGDLVSRIDSLARSQPVLTAVLGLAAGFALVRFARSGREDGESGTYTPGTGAETLTAGEAR